MDWPAGGAGATASLPSVAATESLLFWKFGFRTFAGELPFGIESKDTRDGVRLKVGKEPFNSDECTRPRLSTIFWTDPEKIHWAEGRERSFKYRREWSDAIDFTIEEYELDGRVYGFYFLEEDKKLIGIKVSLSEEDDEDDDLEYINSLA